MSLSGNGPKREYGASASRCALDILLLKLNERTHRQHSRRVLRAMTWKLPAVGNFRRATIRWGFVAPRVHAHGHGYRTAAEGGARSRKHVQAPIAQARLPQYQLACEPKHSSWQVAAQHRNVLHADMQHTTCNMQHTPCNMQHTPCNMPCNMQHRAYDRPKCNIHAAACVACTLPLRPFGRAPTLQQRHGQQSTSALGLGSPPPCLDRDWASPCHICTGVG
jgi:hypothetical protein